MAGLIENTDNDSFIDNSTGLEWMDFGINNGQSYGYVSSQMEIGGVYDGWQLASSDQVYEMWSNAFLGLGSRLEDENYFGLGQLRVIDGRRKRASTLSPILTVMGFNTVTSGSFIPTQSSKGLFEGQSGLSFIEAHERFGMYSDYTHDDFVQIVDNNNYDNYKQNGHAEFSTMLVKVNQVPEPSTFIIFALGMMGLATCRFKKQA